MARGMEARAPLQDAIDAAQLALADVERTLQQAEVDAAQAERSAVERAHGAVDRAAETLLQVIEELEHALSFLQASRATPEPARSLLQRLLILGVAIADQSLGGAHAANAALAVEAAVRTATRLPFRPPLDIAPAERALLRVRQAPATQASRAGSSGEPTAAAAAAAAREGSSRVRGATSASSSGQGSSTEGTEGSMRGGRSRTGREWRKQQREQQQQQVAAIPPAAAPGLSVASSSGVLNPARLRKLSTEVERSGLLPHVEVRSAPPPPALTPAR